MELWIARDRDGGLYTFLNKPYLQTIDKMWLDYPIYIDYKDEHSYHEQLDCNLYPEITFENSPKRIKIEIMEEQNTNINGLAKVAKEFAGIKPDVIIDDEERYYNRDAVEKYEAVLVGGVYVYNKIIDNARKWLEKTLYIHTEINEDNFWGERKPIDWVTSDHDSVEEFVNDFCKAMSESMKEEIGG